MSSEASVSASASPPRSAIAPLTWAPARYLRTLEYDPGGYDARGSASNSRLSGEASDLLLGDLLFHSPHTLGPRAFSLGLSCQSCHPNGAAHVQFELPGLSARPGSVDLSTSFFRPAAEDGIADALDIPSLRGCRYTPPYGRDGRTAGLAEFIQNVITLEFDGPALPAPELAALLRYVLDLDFIPNAKLDAHNRLTAESSAAVRRGERVFNTPRAGFDGASCASCHPASSFFRDGRVHRLGTGSPPSPHALDGAYETPTLLGLAETAPYFHDGRFGTLAEVVTWFDHDFQLGLNEGERGDLSAYLAAVGAVDRPRDDRPFVARLDQIFAYISLLSAGTPPAIWVAAIDAVSAELHDEPEQLRSRADTLRKELAALRGAAQSRDPRAPFFARARTLRRDLSRFAADWAGFVVEPESAR